MPRSRPILTTYSRFGAIVGGLLLLSAVACAGKRAVTGSAPAHHTDEGFRNLHLPMEEQKKSLWSVMKMRFGGDWPDHEQKAASIPL